jgi:hypothetical protein
MSEEGAMQVIKRWAFVPFLVIVCLIVSGALLRSHMSNTACAVVGLVAAALIGRFWDRRRQRAWPTI